MNPVRVADRRMAFVAHLPGRLLGFELAFNKRSQKYPGAASANVMVAEPASVVEGVVYQLTDAAQIAVMDVFEGYPHLYSRSLLPIQTHAGLVQAWTYIANPKHVASGLQPARWYLAHLLAAKPCLSAEYYARLAAIACLPNSDSEP